MNSQAGSTDNGILKLRVTVRLVVLFVLLARGCGSNPVSSFTLILPAFLENRVRERGCQGVEGNCLTSLITRCRAKHTVKVYFSIWAITVLTSEAVYSRFLGCAEVTHVFRSSLLTVVKDAVRI